MEMLRPYQLSVHDSATEAVIYDLTCQINTYDPKTGTSILHGHLLFHEKKEDLDLLKICLELGADPDAPFAKQCVSESNGITAAGELDGGNALHFAVKYNRPDAVAMLLDVGVDTGRTTKHGKTPVDLCAAESMEVKKIVSTRRFQNFWEPSIQLGSFPLNQRMKISENIYFSAKISVKTSFLANSRSLTWRTK
jgi:ankyrin repeat protein